MDMKQVDSEEELDYNDEKLSPLADDGADLDEDYYLNGSDEDRQEEGPVLEIDFAADDDINGIDYHTSDDSPISEQQPVEIIAPVSPTPRQELEEKKRMDGFKKKAFKEPSARGRGRGSLFRQTMRSSGPRADTPLREAPVLWDTPTVDRGTLFRNAAHYREASNFRDSAQFNTAPSHPNFQSSTTAGPVSVPSSWNNNPFHLLTNIQQQVNPWQQSTTQLQHPLLNNPALQILTNRAAIETKLNFQSESFCNRPTVNTQSNSILGEYPGTSIANLISPFRPNLQGMKTSRFQSLDRTPRPLMGGCKRNTSGERNYNSKTVNSCRNYNNGNRNFKTKNNRINGKKGKKAMKATKATNATHGPTGKSQQNKPKYVDFIDRNSNLVKMVDNVEGNVRKTDENIREDEIALDIEAEVGKGHSRGNSKSNDDAIELEDQEDLDDDNDGEAEDKFECIDVENGDQSDVLDEHMDLNDIENAVTGDDVKPENDVLIEVKCQSPISDNDEDTQMLSADSIKTEGSELVQLKTVLMSDADRKEMRLRRFMSDSSKKAEGTEKTVAAAPVRNEPTKATVTNDDFDLGDEYKRAMEAQKRKRDQIMRQKEKRKAANDAQNISGTSGAKKPNLVNGEAKWKETTLLDEDVKPRVAFKEGPNDANQKRCPGFQTANFNKNKKFQYRKNKWDFRQNMILRQRVNLRERLNTVRREHLQRAKTLPEWQTPMSINQNLPHALNFDKNDLTITVTRTSANSDRRPQYSNPPLKSVDNYGNQTHVEINRPPPLMDIPVCQHNQCQSASANRPPPLVDKYCHASSSRPMLRTETFSHLSHINVSTPPPVIERNQMTTRMNSQSQSAHGYVIHKSPPFEDDYNEDPVNFTNGNFDDTPVKTPLQDACYVQKEMPMNGNPMRPPVMKLSMFAPDDRPRPFRQLTNNHLPTYSSDQRKQSLAVSPVQLALQRTIVNSNYCPPPPSLSINEPRESPCDWESSYLTGCIVKVCNLPPKLTYGDLFGMCHDIGNILEIKMLRPKENSAAIRFARSSSADLFYTKFNGFQMGSCFLHVVVI